MDAAIKDVAVYLRKSRGEDETVLNKHRKELIDYVLQNNWRYVEYPEIGDSDSIEFRPVFKKLLNLVTSNLYDAVLVMDYDRLSRGDQEDQGKIKKVFSNSNTYIITLTDRKIYDLANDTDDMLSDFLGMMARFEYKQIKRRLARGKKIGAKLGNWTNGSPPYPYKYEPAIKGLLVDEDKRSTYQFIKEKALEGYPPYDIAWELNKLGILSPKGKMWHPTVVYRLLLDETHLGRIISNKTKGGFHKNKRVSTFKKIPREEWIIVENCHEAVKTEEEHERIKYLFQKRKIIPTAARAGKYPLSGLVKCGVCEAGMQFITKINGKIFVKKCQSSDHFGNKCYNRGGDAGYIINGIHDKLIEYRKDLINNLDEADNKEYQHILYQIEQVNVLIQEKKNVINRIDEAYEKGVYDLDKYYYRMSRAKDELSGLENNLEALEYKLTQTKSLPIEDRIERIDNFLNIIDKSKLGNNKLNEIYKSIIDCIIWKREKEDIEISVNFL